MNLSEPSHPAESSDKIESASARIQERLASLRQEYATGEAQLRVLDERVRQLQQTMLRIQGAITALEELLSEEQASAR